MRLLRVTVTSLLLLLCTPIGHALPTIEQAGNAAIGGAVGGLLGNQIGNGRGKTIATAAGAATGVVIASGCKATFGTAIGGVLGGVLGSQVGGGNGSNIMAGVGASVGALLGSDCQPGAEPVAVAPLLGVPPFEINGLTLTPVNGFPQEAFYGIPPIVTPNDMFAAAKMVRRLTDIALEARANDNPELAVLSMYWAKRISTTATSILYASLQSIQTNTGKAASIPAKGLVILPAFNEFRPANQHQALFDAMKEMLYANEYAYNKGVMVADNGGFGAALDFLNKALAPPAPRSASGQSIASASDTAIPRGLVGLPLNVALRAPDGVIFMKTDDALTIHNPNDKASDFSLDEIDFMARTAKLSPARQAASDLMFAINKAETEWTFNEYRPRIRGRYFETHIVAPNKIVDREDGDTAVAYLGDTGRVTSFPEIGEHAYRTNNQYSSAVDILEAIEMAPPVRAHINSCIAAESGHYYTLDGLHANLMQAVCFQGQYSDKNKMYVRTFYVGERGKNLVQSRDSVLLDSQNQDAMDRALINGKAFSDMTAFVPGLSNVEAGLACTGKYTLGQQNAIAGAVLKSHEKETYELAKQRADQMSKPSRNMYNKKLSLMSGWVPPPADEWGFDRVVDCITAIPLIGYAGSMVNLADKVALRAGGYVLSGLTEKRINLLRDITDAFATPVFFKNYMKDIRNVQTIFPENPSAASFVKATYDVLMHSQNMGQTADGFSNLKFN